MKNTNYILEELNIISPLISKIEKKDTYSVPLAYFEDLPEKIFNRITMDKQRAGFPGTSASFSIPENYFKNLPELILHRLGLESGEHNDVYIELQEIAPLLNTISKQPVLRTPPNYFEKIIIDTKQSTSKGKVKSMSKNVQFAKIAAAAVIIPFIAIGIYNITTNEFKGVRSNNSNARNAVKNLSREEIISFLKNENHSQDGKSTSPNTVKNNRIKRSLKQISDKEIQEFLKETGETDEI